MTAMGRCWQHDKVIYASLSHLELFDIATHPSRMRTKPQSVWHVNISKGFWGVGLTNAIQSAAILLFTVGAGLVALIERRFQEALR